ncbi:MAG TPA: sigma-70 family RNA polymerase sigma factor [Chitinophagaceae bacterium]|nr:sigma-70 family RNA polymerase sigma factor [Chitinophagaceae bacterium]HPH33357.1 sigma-70 family RNA polymerase sigma factor [Chitinophagaceae bacterium]HPN60231.1 sigma-70 family RNA polymerase sigma factor [Chitinophagaceae bacterium]
MLSYYQMSAGQNDNELISKVLRGDHLAYAGLVNRYQNYVFTLTLRLVKNREEAEEVAQDVFIKAYKYLADFRGDSKFSTWLYTIVNNTCISFLRKKKLIIHSLDDERVFAKADNQDAGFRADGVEQKSRHVMVGEAISRLKPDDASIITLFYKNEQSLEEIAQVLGLEVNTAKVRLHRARARLKELMETHYAHEVKDLN